MFPEQEVVLIILLFSMCVERWYIGIDDAVCLNFGFCFILFIFVVVVVGCVAFPVIYWISIEQ
jgi:hypothetical protein